MYEQWMRVYCSGIKCNRWRCFFLYQFTSLIVHFGLYLGHSCHFSFLILSCWFFLSFYFFSLSLGFCRCFVNSIFKYISTYRISVVRFSFLSDIPASNSINWLLLFSLFSISLCLSSPPFHFVPVAVLQFTAAIVMFTNNM